MKLIKDLSDSKKNKIVETLTQDGFKNISIKENCIRFEEGTKVRREYLLFSTDLDDDDLGVRIDFDFEKFMDQNYIHKTRHSVSLKDAVEAHGSIEDACLHLEWNMVQTKDLNKEPEHWHAGLHMDIIYEVIVSNIPHVIINEEVYEGPLTRVWSMGSKSARELLSGYKISALLDKMNLD